jgi:hypothetical protein
MNNIGRAVPLPKAVQRDIGAVDPEDNTFDRRKAAAHVRKRQRLEASNSTAATTTTTATNSTTPATSTPFTVKAPFSKIVKVLEAGIKQANELQEILVLSII